MSRLVLTSPLAGWAAPLAEVPDPVFAQGMMGEGLAIDPTAGRLVAPCDATVLKVHAARHAVTLRAANGAEILLHAGLETVGLRGEGFEALVADGQAVKAGELLIRFDLDAIAQRAPSLISPMLVTNPVGFAVEVLAQGREVAEGEPVLSVEGAASNASDGDGDGDGDGRTLGRRVRITHEHGLHARPAARIAAEAKRWSSQLLMAAGGKLVQARSPLEIMALGVRAGDEIELRASGADAEAALAALEKAIGEINEAPTPVLVPAPVQGVVGGIGIAGVRAAPGLAIGPAWRLKSADAPVAKTSQGAAIETAALAKALAFTRGDIEARMARLSGEARSVLEAHLALLDDDGLTGAARRRILEGLAAGVAWREAVDLNVRSLQGVGDPRLAERAIDLKDLEQRVLWALSGQTPPPPEPTRGCILLADDLLPGDLAAMADAGLAGLATARGGPTSHVAILAQALEIPALAAAGDAVLEIADGAMVLLDADAGRLDPAPGADRLAGAAKQIAERNAAGEAARAAASGPATTADGVHVAVLANLGSVEEAALAARNGADGCGLLRTEFLFLDRTQAPSQDEQGRDYQAIAQALAGKPVTIRTLDVGGDKPAPYLGLPAEENPALGVRGVRISLRRPELLAAQLKAIAGVRPAGQCRVMVPMVTGVAELAAVRRAAASAGAGAIELGAMIETPAAAATTDLIAAEAQFLSIGTNDLAQYVLAMDRGNPALAAEVDALHPAVLRLIRTAVEGAQAHKRPVAVCGGLAADLAAVPILIGLGVTELSVPPASVPAVKALVRTLDAGACRTLAVQACDATSAAEVRALKLAAAKPRRTRKGASA
jgi:phosphocarrier protein FPr/phosphocarrier protein